MDIGGGCGGSASRYEAAFREREIDERVFPSLTQEDLTEIGVGPVRITGQLIDAVTGRHLWADRFERDLTDVFALQDEVTAAVVSAFSQNCFKQKSPAHDTSPPRNWRPTLPALPRSPSPACGRKRCDCCSTLPPGGCQPWARPALTCRSFH